MSFLAVAIAPFSLLSFSRFLSAAPANKWPLGSKKEPSPRPGEKQAFRERSADLLTKEVSGISLDKSSPSSNSTGRSARQRTCRRLISSASRLPIWGMLAG